MKISCRYFILILSIGVLCLSLPQLGHSKDKKAVEPNREGLMIVPFISGSSTVKIMQNAENKDFLTMIITSAAGNKIRMEIRVDFLLDFLQAVADGDNPEPYESRSSDNKKEDNFMGTDFIPKENNQFEEEEGSGGSTTGGDTMAPAD